jgi:glucose-1-phosphate cytidylyltransferase
MKVVILAGGAGTRFSEATNLRPKPMVEIGGRPMVWHIMKHYSHYGMNDFIICCGYKGYVLKEYFLNYRLHSANVTVDLASGGVDIHSLSAEPWRVTLMDTGLHTMTAGRVKRVASLLTEPFCLTYGDGLSDVDLGKLLETHKRVGKIATVTAVKPAGRYGVLDMRGDGTVTRFDEKPAGDNAWINGGFFVVEPRIFDYIVGDEDVWERGPLKRLLAADQLAAYAHRGFWHSMDTAREHQQLEALWKERPPWKVWQ